MPRRSIKPQLAVFSAIVSAMMWGAPNCPKPASIEAIAASLA
jgi:hypothetical protein